MTSICESEKHLFAVQTEWRAKFLWDVPVDWFCKFIDNLSVPSFAKNQDIDESTTVDNGYSL